MARAPKSPESSRADWLPWFLSVFGASCALFVLVKGVLPARSANAHLMERVSRLESAAQNASSERASLEQAKGHLQEQYNSAQAQISGTHKEREQENQAQQLARTEMSQTFGDQVAAGDLWFEQRQGELAIGIREGVLFNGDRTEVTWKGRRFLQAFAENLKHLPPQQRFEIAGHFDPSGAKASSSGKPRSGWDVSSRRAASVARYLEDTGGIEGSRLMAAGFSGHHPEGGDRIEVVLLNRAAAGGSAAGGSAAGGGAASGSAASGGAEAKTRSPL